MDQVNTLGPTETARHFSEFPLLALRAEKPLRRLVTIGDLFGTPCCSLRCVAKRIEELPDGFSLSTIRSLPRDPALSELLFRSFGRAVELYRRQKGGRLAVIGLTEEGLMAIQFARAFLAELDSQAP